MNDIPNDIPGFIYNKDIDKDNKDIIININKSIDKNKEYEESLECVICLEELKEESKENKEYIISLKCSHFFHYECIEKWYKKNPTCPICRNNIEVKDIDIRDVRETSNINVTDVYNNNCVCIFSFDRRCLYVPCLVFFFMTVLCLIIQLKN